MIVSQKSMATWPKVFAGTYFYNNKHDILIACDCRIDKIVSLGHSVTIGRGCILRNRVSIGNNVYIKSHCYLGLNCTVLSGETISDGPFLTAGYNQYGSLNLNKGE